MIFKHKINFVIPEDKVWPEIVAGTDDTLTEDDKADRSVSSLDNFVIVPYLHFKQMGAEVERSPDVRPGYINIANARNISVRRRNPFAFLVVTRGDAFFPEVADFVIEHNDCRQKTDRAIYLPHPPLPGLIPRDTTRTEPRTIVYKGIRRNFDPMFLTDSFAADLARLGFELRIDDFQGMADGHGTAVHDFSDGDIALAVRNITVDDAEGKPANKLVNAWRAGTPALLGPEPAYQELRRSELDYFEVSTAEDVIASLSALREKPELYAAMVENGHERAVDFMPDAIYGKWIEGINGPITARFEAWSRESALSKLLFAGRAALQGKRSFDTYLASVRDGPRILDVSRA